MNASVSWGGVFRDMLFQFGLVATLIMTTKMREIATDDGVDLELLSTGYVRMYVLMVVIAKWTL